MPSHPAILFAGGGTAGHIHPNLAVVERLHQMGVAGSWHFLVSTRPLDARVLEHQGLAFTALPIKPWPTGLRLLRAGPGFVRSWFASVRQVRQLLRQMDVAAVVATGGFVAAPVVAAAVRASVPVAVVNLDAVPGRANRALGRRATTVFSVVQVPTDTEHSQPPPPHRIGLPLRASALGHRDPRKARTELDLDPNRDTLLITGGSQGARSINRMTAELLTRPAFKTALRGWQVLHLAGSRHRAADQLQQAYRLAGVPARVVDFCHEMGAAWSAATVAISRAGACSVAEAWASNTPTIFLPYPHHKDLHQRHNVAGPVRIGGALVCRDGIDPRVNTSRILDPLTGLLCDPDQRNRMIQRINNHQPPDGAQAIARWLIQTRPRHATG